MNTELDNMLLRGAFFNDRNAYIASQEPAIFHCHHYNCYLQAVLLDAAHYVNGISELLVDSAQEVAYAQFQNYFSQSEGLSESDKKHIIEDYYRFCGYGKIDLSNISNAGGTVQSDSDHYGIGWKSKFGKNSSPVSYFSTGFLAGAIEALYGHRLGTLHATQNQCIAKGDTLSRFQISKNGQRSLNTSQKEGEIQKGTLHQPNDSGVNYAAVREALTNMPLEGAPGSGLMEAFGVMLTRHYANYYCNISYGFLKLFEDQVGSEEIAVAGVLLTEAAHVCAFHTFGGIAHSNEWNAMIKPMLSSKEDWVHGLIAVVNALGWGFWEVQELTPEKIVVKVTGGYEANSYLKRYKEKPGVPISFLATGGVAGLMNLIYVLDLPAKIPITLDEQLYKEISNQPNIFKGRQIKCRAQGDEYDLIEASRQA